MSETSPPSLMQESHPVSHRALSENDVRVLIPETPPGGIVSNTSTEILDGHEAYEQGSALKNVGLFKQAAEHFQKAAQDPVYALKGLAQMGLCLKQSGKQEEAITAFRRALQIPTVSSKEQVQILYLLGRTLESLGRIPDALESYRWLRREAPQYRDVAKRIESLSTRRLHTTGR
jgi:tetratricopeptide (TPR) repeat protein